jgi:hypothetical protein
MIIGMSFTKFLVYADRKSKMATTAGHRLTLDPMVFCSDMHFKMAAMAGLSLTLDPTCVWEECFKTLLL